MDHQQRWWHFYYGRAPPHWLPTCLHALARALNVVFKMWQSAPPLHEVILLLTLLRGNETSHDAILKHMFLSFFWHWIGVFWSVTMLCISVSKWSQWKRGNNPKGGLSELIERVKCECGRMSINHHWWLVIGWVLELVVDTASDEIEWITIDLAGLNTWLDDQRDLSSATA